MKDFISKIPAVLNDLEPVSDQPTENIAYEIITFDGSEKDNAKWKVLISEYIKTAKTFEIHCWKEEQDEITLALQYGALKDFNWKYGKVIAGSVTPEFIVMLLNMPKPIDTVVSNKMTPFFSIFFDNGFSSEHYGTENIIRELWGNE